MTADGKNLEALVAYAEETLLPKGFTVTTNERVFNDEGVQIAEFDIEIRGKVGSTSIAWLIECRDRPANGPAPGAWIEQLVGRRTRFGFNKVTAVSTTGFAPGATDFAHAQGIELREVKSLAPEEFTDWLKIQHIHHIEQNTMLVGATFQIDESELNDKRHLLTEILSKVGVSIPFLKSSKSGLTTTLTNVFTNAVTQIDGLFEGLIANGSGKQFRVRASFTDDDYLIVETTDGPVRIRAILFVGEAHLKEALVPLMGTVEYRHTKTGEVISQVASFAPQLIHGKKFSTEMHKIGDTGETHVVIRRLTDDT